MPRAVREHERVQGSNQGAAGAASRMVGTLVVVLTLASAPVPAQNLAPLRPAGPAQQDPRPDAPLDAQTVQRIRDAQNVGPLSLDPRELLSGRLPPGFARLSESFNVFSGFPSFPESGQVGGALGTLPPAFGDPSFAPPIGPAEPRAPDAWPTWFADAPGEEGDRFLPSRAVLVRQSDRVWFRDAEESVFVPVRFSRKFRAVEAGDVVEVRQKGEFELLLQDGGTLKTFSRVRVEVLELSEDVVSFRVPHARRIEVRPLVRKMRVQLPDGSVLEATEGSYRWIERDDGLAHLQNVGTEDATLHFSAAADAGSTPLPSGYQVVLRATRSAAGSAPGGRDGKLVVEGDATAAFDGSIRVFSGRGEGGTVTWAGARFPMPAGGELRIDPLGDVVPAAEKMTARSGDEGSPRVLPAVR